MPVVQGIQVTPLFNLSLSKVGKVYVHGNLGAFLKLNLRSLLAHMTPLKDLRPLTTFA